jgi:hypothetical protein
VRAADQARDEQVDRRLRDAQAVVQQQRDRDQHGAADQQQQVPAA